MKSYQLVIKALVALSIGLVVENNANDTLRTITEFSAPISNPRAIEWDGDCFWLANIQKPFLYSVDTNMVLIDSLRVSHSRIVDIAFSNSLLWIAIDSVAKDTIIAGTKYKIFGIYQINSQTGVTQDSLLFRTSLVGIRDTGFIFGFTVSNDSFYIALAAGYSSGVYSINNTGNPPILIEDLALSGLTEFDNQIWGIRRYGSGAEGNLVTNLQRKDDTPFVISYYATDIAFDGKDLTLCNMRDSKIVQTQLPTTHIKRDMSILKSGKKSNSPFALRIGNRQHLWQEYYNMNGQLNSNVKRNQTIAVYIVKTNATP